MNCKKCENKTLDLDFDGYCTRCGDYVAEWSYTDGPNGQAQAEKMQAKLYDYYDNVEATTRAGFIVLKAH